MNPKAKLFSLICTLAAVALCGCERPAPATETFVTYNRFEPAAVQGQRALDEVAALVAINPRDAGTEGGLRAAEHLKARLEAVGVSTEIDAFEDETPLGPLTFRNVIGRLKGQTDRLVVMASHYDTKRDMPPAFEGANDSGSSSGLLIELARVFAEGPQPVMDLVFVFFDGEECIKRYGPSDGLHGSRRFVQDLVDSGRARDVAGVIVIDMIGDRDLQVTIPRNVDPVMASTVFQAAREQGLRTKFGLLRGEMIDDHVPFVAAVIPVVNLIDFTFGSAPGKNDYWHTAEDTLDKLSAESLEQVGRVVVETVNLLGEKVHAEK
jgi:glutaminyl-peptide cyclotransferase